MAKKGTKAHGQETVEIYYGINRTTREIDMVFRSRNGVLSKYGRDAMVSTHHIHPGRRPETEIVIVWGLSDVFGVPPNMTESVSTKIRLEELQAKLDQIQEKGDGS